MCTFVTELFELCETLPEYQSLVFYLFLRFYIYFLFIDIIQVFSSLFQLTSCFPHYFHVSYQEQLPLWVHLPQLPCKPISFQFTWGYLTKLLNLQNSYFHLITLRVCLIALILPSFLAPSALQHSFLVTTSPGLFFRTILAMLLQFF